MSSASIVEYFGKNTKSSCGYCKGKKSSCSHGMWAHYLTPQDYQDMIDRGWRRSGKYCYKPCMSETCCPQYTIRCNASEFNPTKKHKKVLKQFRNYVVKDAGAAKKKCLAVDAKAMRPEFTNPLYSDDDCEDSDDAGGESAAAAAADDEFQSENVDMVEQKVAFDGQKVETAVAAFINTGATASSPSNEKSASKGLNGPSSKPVDEPRQSSSSPAKKPRPGAGPDPSKPKARKAKDIRLEKARLKGKPEKQQQQANNNKQASLEELTEFFMRGDQSQNCHTFDIRLVRATDEDQEFERTFDESFKVYQKYQVMIHKDRPGHCTANQMKRFLCSSPILEGLPPKVDSSKLAKQDEFPCSYFPPAYGAYHQQYILDGKIICVAVLDVLPDCVSGKYLYYDPDFSFLSLGTVSALYEIAFVRQLRDYWSDRLKYYYMGFYIHSCPKMRYKSQYGPCKLLCPQTFRWTDVEACSPLLDKAKYSRLEADPSHPNQLEVDPPQASLDSVSVLHRHRAMSYAAFARDFVPKTHQKGERAEVAEYLTLVGEKAAKNILLFRSDRAWAN